MPPVSTIDLSAESLWLTVRSATGARPRALEHLRYCLGHLKDWRLSMGGDPDLATVSRFEALAYLQHSQERYKAGGVACRLKTLRAFYTWCLDEELIATNPFKGLTVRVPDEVRPTATDADVERMMIATKRHPRDQAIVALLADSGARKHEIAALEVRHIDLRSGIVTYPVSKSQPRTVPLTDRAVLALAKWLRKRGMAPGCLWACEDPYSLVREACKRASGGTVSPHQLRRRFAITFLLKGGSETSLMRLCGWSSREMISLYTRASGDQIAAQEFRALMMG